MNKTTQTDIQIRFADIDIFKHVNNVNLQHYFDTGKGDFMRKALDISLVDRAKGLITVATSTSYLEQTRYDEDIYVETGVEKIGTKSLTLFQRIVNRKNGAVHAESRSVMVAYDFANQQSVPVFPEWIEVFKRRILK